MNSGSGAIQRVISDSESGGPLDWIVSENEDQSGVEIADVSTPDQVSVTSTLSESISSESDEDESYDVEKIMKHRVSQCNSADGMTTMSSG